MRTPTMRTSTVQSEAELACLQALMDAYETARSDGLCKAGAWEVAHQQIMQSEWANILVQLSIPISPPSE